MRALRVVLCDDHLMLLEGLSNALTAHGHIVEACVTNPRDLVRVVDEVSADVCILDLSFPEGDGLSVAAQIIESNPSTKILLLSGVMNAEVVRRGIQIGIQGFLSKSASLEEILESLARLGAGQVAIDADLFRRALSPPSRASRGPVDDPMGELTPREREVLSCIVGGADTAQIALRLGITTSTARAHVQNVLMKLGVHTRLQAVAYVVAHGGLEAG